MDIDLSLLRTMEREKEIPFDELVQIIEQAILTAYLKHTNPAHGRTARRSTCASWTARPVTSRSSFRELDDDGNVIGEAETARATSAASPPSPPSRSSTSVCATSPTTRCSASSAAREGDIVAGVDPAGPEPAHGARRPRHRSRRSCPPRSRSPGEEYTHGSRIRVYVTSVAKGQGPADHRLAHAPGARAQALRARGARDRHAASSRSSRSPARPATAPRSPCARPSPASTPRAPASASSASACAPSPPSSATRRSTSSTTPPTCATFVANALSPAKVTSAFVIDESTQGRARARSRLPALARDRQGGPERPPRREADRREDRHPARLRSSRRAEPTARRQAGAQPRGVRWNPLERASDAVRASPRILASEGRRREFQTSSPMTTASLPGRGAWVHPTIECVEAAIRRRAFGRALRVSAAIWTRSTFERTG